MTGSKKEKVKEKVNEKSKITLSLEKLFIKYRECRSQSTWWSVFLAILVLTFLTRFYRVSDPKHVVWDETHFGKFASWYINRTFFFDVHPPLGKMLIGAFGYMSGYDGRFAFEKPGDSYESVNYLGMRICCTMMGAALVPFSFVTVWEMTTSLPAATIAASLILFDVGFITLNQYILLDPILLFFIMGSVMGYVKFKAKRSFTVSWWFWLCFTGIMLSGSICVKFVGLFVVVYVGLNTISDLWSIYGDYKKNSMISVLKHFICRAVGLILVPIVMYLLYFYIHLTVLSKSGNGDGFYSSAFQSQLEGNSLYNASMPYDLAIGAEITLKNSHTGGAYLHSHIHLYPEGVGARQQQITTYSHKDFNNQWLIKKETGEPGDWEDNEPIELVRNGDLIRLEHVPTGRNLHAHREQAPVTHRHFQVTGYGENGVGDLNDIWRVEIPNGKVGDPVNTVVTKFKLLHYLVGCALMSHNKQLPKWGFEQMEVTCSPNLHDPNTLWNIEENVFPNLPNRSFEIYAPNFLEKFIESHTVMFQGNSGLKPKEGEVTSQPWQWPINYKGQWFSAIDGFKIYLLGNPLIWWGNLVIMALFALIFLFNGVRAARGYQNSPKEQKRRETTVSACGWLFLGWALHYLPFYFMGRILYFHHYFPALLFSSMLSGVILNYIIEELIGYFNNDLISSSVYATFTALVFSSLIYSFYLFSPLCYGMFEPFSTQQNHTMHGLKWLDTWEF